MHFSTPWRAAASAGRPRRGARASRPVPQTARRRGGSTAREDPGHPRLRVDCRVRTAWISSFRSRGTRRCGSMRQRARARIRSTGSRRVRPTASTTRSFHQKRYRVPVRGGNRHRHAGVLGGGRPGTTDAAAQNVQAATLGSEMWRSSHRGDRRVVWFAGA